MRAASIEAYVGCAFTVLTCLHLSLSTTFRMAHQQPGGGQQPGPGDGGNDTEKDNKLRAL